jgi:hypothetical protein
MHMQIHIKTTHKNLIIYLGNNEIYSIFKTRYIISVVFSTKLNLCQNFPFSFGRGGRGVFK